MTPIEQETQEGLFERAYRLSDLHHTVTEYFKWLDATKRWPSAGFAKPKNEAEKKLRRLIGGRL